MRTRHLLPLISLAMVAVLLGACGSSSKNKAASAKNPVKLSSVPGTSVAGSDASGFTTPATPADTGKHYSGDSGSAFCTTYHKYDTYFSGHTDEANSPQKAIDAMKDLRTKAPSALKDDLATFIDFEEQLSSIDTSNLSAQESLSSGQLGRKAESAIANLTNYLKDVCRININS